MEGMTKLLSVRPFTSWTESYSTKAMPSLAGRTSLKPGHCLNNISSIVAVVPSGRLPTNKIEFASGSFSCAAGAGRQGGGGDQVAERCRDTEERMELEYGKERNRSPRGQTPHTQRVRGSCRREHIRTVFARLVGRSSRS